VAAKDNTGMQKVRKQREDSNAFSAIRQT